MDGHGRPPVRPHRQRQVLVAAAAQVAPAPVGDPDVAAPVAEEGEFPHRCRRALDQGQQRPSVGGVADLGAEQVGDGGVEVDRGGERVDLTGRPPGHRTRSGMRPSSL